MATCNLVAEVAPPTSRPPQKQKGEAPPGPIRIHYVDKLPPQLGVENPAGFVMYAVEEVNSRGRSAGLSNQVAIPVVPTIPAPEKLSASVNEEAVRISWVGPNPPVPPAGVTYRYRIMRRPVGAPAYVVLDNVAPAASGTYLDKTFAWEQKYEYRITTLSEVHANGLNGAVEGDDSRPVESCHARHLSASPARRATGSFLGRGTKAIHRPELGSKHGSRPRWVQRFSQGRGGKAAEAEYAIDPGPLLSRRSHRAGKEIFLCSFGGGPARK